MEEIIKNIDQIKQLCNTNGVKSLYAFGSVTRDDLMPESDIDLVVDIDDEDPLSYSDKYFDLKFNLEKIFGRRIDLLELKAIQNRFIKKEIERTKLLIYG